VGIYTEHLVPRLINFAMRGEQFQKLRRNLVGQAKGRVLEIGIGSGLNLPHYGAGVDHVTEIDPSETGLVLAEKEAQNSATEVELILGSAEKVPVPDVSFDTVVSIWTLCSVPSVEAMVAEMYRGLKPGGKFCFIEHGLAEDPNVVRRRHRLTPMMKRALGAAI
jgi:ubiquinone/menaquinone biosynthesis C-methylase UbiE